METIERKPRSRENARAGILGTAKAIARREGWQAVSIRKIADAIEYSAPIVYEYFDSKDVLLNEIRNEGFRHLHQEYERIVKLYRDPEKRLYEISLIQWEFARQQPEIYQVMYNLDGAYCTIPVDQSEAMQAVSDVVSATIFSFIPKAKESIQRLYFEWWSVSHGMITLAMLLKDQQPLDKSEQVYREAMRRFVRGLR
ncbi:MULTISPECIES: TetR/AcrR family transcriptional regulator [Spirosoma]|uniref:TetR/AcrR family transcriptional regulator n=1 Tax=Spirosoma liriopis TaxID=2937440 RepID=A0ABT0HQS3_9BACT|nr:MULTISPECIES: TetR/AcrR family transcriptional regulator [Spirosoma]MCK8494335.1 TetR/AcrR family transcriptional regulator [Spirosoma liriopis]UHG89346.1 TetR/AcrR family transcriptional regulator [Spirosoma oryzicola]